MGALQYPADRRGQMFVKNCAYLYIWHHMLRRVGSTIHIYNLILEQQEEHPFLASFGAVQADSSTKSSFG